MTSHRGAAGLRGFGGAVGAAALLGMVLAAGAAAAMALAARTRAAAATAFVILPRPAQPDQLTGRIAAATRAATGPGVAEVALLDDARLTAVLRPLLGPATSAEFPAVLRVTLAGPGPATADAVAARIAASVPEAVFSATGGLGLAWRLTAAAAGLTAIGVGGVAGTVASAARLAPSVPEQPRLTGRAAVAGAGAVMLAVPALVGGGALLASVAPDSVPGYAAWVGGAGVAMPVFCAAVAGLAARR